ncbi:phage antirepressor N-terminal domain-containing protein [Streptosporangium canum]|uniref:phage antirepressor N-terminal domain-containing protein n=1 Tax=Streptosporangium canum TaxID=324952 RepID=UPI0036C9783C
MTDIVKIAFHGGYLHTALGDDQQPVVILKPTIKAMGLDWAAQYTKLQRRSWAVVGQTPTTGPDGKVYEMASCGLDTWSMLLANIDENRVNEGARPLVIAYQKESAQALRDYWTKGGAVNPNATTEQLDELDRTIRRAKDQAAVLATLRDIVDKAWLDAKGRHVAAIALGVEPDIDLASRPLTVGEYLEARGLTGTPLRSLSPSFGKRVKRLYREQYSAEPPVVDRFIDGALRPVAAYTEAHRDLFDQAWLALLDTR